jgi:hypothetical protein
MSVIIIDFCLKNEKTINNTNEFRIYLVVDGFLIRFFVTTQIIEFAQCL